MSFFSRKKLPASGLASHWQQPWLVCTWSARSPQSGLLSGSPLPRSSHTVTTTPTTAGKLFLFGGNDVNNRASSDVYVISTREYSTTLLQTRGDIPAPRFGHSAAITSTTLLIWGGTSNSDVKDALNHESLYLLNLESRDWTRIVINGPGPSGRHYHTTTFVGSKLFVFGGSIGRNDFNDMWALDLNSPYSPPLWESFEPILGNQKPLPRSGHVSVTTEDRIIIFGGMTDGRHYHNDTWMFDISTRKWTELQCIGPIPSPRAGHSAVLVDNVMYVFGGYDGNAYLDDLTALQLPTRQWFKFHNEGASPLRRSHHAMASDGTRIFVLGGYSPRAHNDNIRLIHVFDTKHIKYPKSEPNAVNPNVTPIQLAQLSSAALEDGVSGSREYHAKFAVPQSSSEGDVASLEYERFMQLERQLSALLIAQTERDQRIAQLTDELALKSSLLEQFKANAAEGEGRARLELREHEDRLLAQTSLVKQRDAELVNIQSKLRDTEANFEESLLSHDQQIRRYRAEVANVRAELEMKKSELEVKKSELEAQTSLVKQRDAVLVDMQSKLRNTGSNLDESLLSRDQQIRRYRAELENVFAELEAKKSELEAVRKTKPRTSHTGTAASLIDLNEDRSMYGLKEYDLESLQCNE